MIRPYASLGLLALVACASTPTSTYQGAGDTAHSIALAVGQRSIDSELDEGVVEDMAVFGVEYAYEAPGSAVGFEIALFSGSGDGDFPGGEMELETTEIALGVRKSFGGEGAITPYVGGGLAFLDSEQTVTFTGLGSASGSADTIAPYIHGGVNYDVSESVFIGVDVRAVVGAEYEDVGDLSGDYVQFGFVVGFGF